MKAEKTSENTILVLWIHEASRVFRDRLTTQEDRDFFNEIVSSQLSEIFAEEWQKDYENLLYGDYLEADINDRKYERIDLRMTKVQDNIQEYLDEYNATH